MPEMALEIDRSDDGRLSGPRRDELIDPLLAASAERHALAAEKVYADDIAGHEPRPGVAARWPRPGGSGYRATTVPVRHPNSGGRLPASYSPDRRGEHPQDHLRHFRGVLQADAYGGWARCNE